MANNSHGNRNETNIAIELNGKKFKDLPITLKTFIKEIYPDIKDYSIISAEATIGVSKTDLQIKIDDFLTFISIKEGSGNSVHQEQLDQFLKMLEEECVLTEDIFDCFKFYIWGDNSLDGKGNKEDRMTASDLKKAFPEKIENIQNFFNKNAKKLLTRFLVTGKYNNGHIKYIYYGTSSSGIWASSEDIINYHLDIIEKNIQSKTPSIGNLTFQSWNRCINGIAKEKQRGTIQLKWASIKKDIEFIQKKYHSQSKDAYAGSQSEFDLVAKLNKDKTSKLWKILQDELLLANVTNIFAVKVSKKIKSILTGELVLPKTDVYLIYSDEITDIFLNEYNYSLDEALLVEKQIKFSYVDKSGISVKKYNSKNYSIHKFSYNSFYKTFGNTILAAGASLFCEKSDEVTKNLDVLKGWQVTEVDFLKFLEEETLEYFQLSNEKYINKIKYIKKECIKRIKNLVLSDERIKDIIFKGDFNEPYKAYFIMRNKNIEKNIITNFYVTTGSGRSKGKYSIVFKPKF